MALRVWPTPPLTHLNLHRLQDDQWQEQGLHDTTQKQEMDPILWSQLPDCLLDTVLQHLPAPSQARFQAVSKRWRSLLSCPDFISAHDPGSFSTLWAFEPSPPRYECIPHRVEDSSTPSARASILGGREHALDLTPLPLQFRHPHHGMLKVAAQCGLVCIGSQEWSPRGIRICLCNPANGTWRQLPDLRCKTWEDPGAQMAWEAAVVADRRSFRVLVIAEVRDSAPCFCVFSGSAWSVTELQAELRVLDHSRRVVCQGVMYALVDGPEMVMLDATCGEEVGRLGPGKLPLVSFIGNVHLAEWQGNVVMVQAEVRQCRIWTLDPTLAEAGWKQIAVMPDHVLAQMKLQFAANEPGLPFHCWLMEMAVAGHTIFLHLRARGQTHLVAYHFLLKRWRVVLHDAWYCHTFCFLDPRPTLRL